MPRMKLLWLVLVATSIFGCPKRMPEEEMQAAEQATAGLDETAPCAPETTQAARTMMDNARALIKEERYEEAKTALLAAQRLAEKARRECDEKKAAEAARQASLPEPPPEQPAAKTVEEDTGPGRLQTVYFGFNEAALTDEAREIMARNADYLRHRPELRVQIEGHCDERGSTEYNLALGERRALTVKEYLVKLGVEPRRMEIISYGEERPADPRQVELAWARNRRAEFRELH